MTEPHLPDAPKRVPPAAMSPALRIWDGFTAGLAALGTLMVGLLMIVVCADVFARNVLGGSLPLVSELGALIVVLIVYLQLAAAIRHGRLARAEIIFDWLVAASPRTAAALAGAFDAVGALMCTVLAVSTFGILSSDLRFGESIGVTGVMTLPVWPFRALILLGLIVATIQFLILFVAGVRRAVRSR